MLHSPTFIEAGALAVGLAGGDMVFGVGPAGAAGVAVGAVATAAAAALGAGAAGALPGRQYRHA